MPNPEEQSNQDVSEGTETLQEIADEVEAEREQAGRKMTVPDDDTPEDDGETREDHQDDGDPKLGATPVARVEQSGGTIRP
ncbi:hypothetical protein [Demequina activiva]|uniref:Uncharacterized protein n=1 Tax=Demequina activiva TaxID=1582364 RepID=A0A919Q3L8_9MICO|nr:hypothetical protein [Demequina activiva]GIG55444.1 hypothetical protein Dac01nite_21960 [Demequina activiva]